MSPVKFIGVSEFKAKATAIIAEVKKTGRQVVVTVNGQPTVIISPAKDEDFEIVKGKK